MMGRARGSWFPSRPQVLLFFVTLRYPKLPQATQSCPKLPEDTLSYPRLPQALFFLFQGKKVDGLE